jgi:exopolysaccharide production protein ExoZ
MQITMLLNLFRWLATRFELSREVAGTNLRALEGMRGFAVTLVFLTHFCTLIGPWIASTPALDRFAHAVHAIGNTGVDLFFVLSGYLIYKTLVTREQGFGGFMMRRIRRIYPTFLVVFAVYCVLSFVFPRESSIPADGALAYVAANLLLLPGLFPIKPMITVAWSLSYEMFFYLCLPLVVTLLHLRRRSNLQRICFVAAVAIALAAWSAVSGAGHIRMIMFMSGMLIHDAIASRQVRAPSGMVAAAALVIGLAGSLLPVTGYVKIGLLFASFFLVCMHCFLRPQAWLARAFCWTPMRWLGNMSYSYYLLHGLTLKALFMFVPHSAALADHALLLFVLLLPLFFAATLFTSGCLYLLVERPLSLAAPKRVANGAVPSEAMRGTN